MTFRRAVVAQFLILCAVVPGARAEQYNLERAGARPGGLRNVGISTGVAVRT
jgi:hypothetical protein